MWGAAPRRRLALGFVLGVVAAIACATPGAAATRAKLPAQLWAVQASAGSATSVARSVRGTGLNGLLVDGRRAKPGQLRAAARAAARNRLTLLVSSARAGRSPAGGRAALAACRRLKRTLARAACTVTARTLADAPALARRTGVDVVVVHVGSPGRLAALKPSGRARLLALVPLRSAGFDPEAWRAAVAAAGTAARLDLAVAGNAAALRLYAPLIRERGPRSTPTPPPGAPHGLRVLEAAAASLTLGWSAPAGVRPASYKLYVDGAYAGTAITETMTLAGLKCATTYRVDVESVSSGGAASSRAAADAKTAACPGGGGGGGGGGGDTTNPSAPTNLTKTSSTPTSISLSWTASFDNVAVTGYQVFADGAGAGNAAGTSHTVSGLACGKTYSFGVEARDAAGNLSARSTMSASTSACPGGGGDTSAPTTPGGLATTSTTAAAIAVSWNASTDNVGVTGYGLFRNGASVASTGNRTYTFSGLGCGATYTLAVDAYDAAGNRSGKAALTASTSACAPPPPGSGSVPVYTKDNPPATPALADLPKQSSVTKDGITWTFSQAVPVGRFITGDPYVVGPVTVTAIDPQPANGRNGSVKNIPPTVDESGFDSRTSSNRYEAGLRSDPPVSLVPGDSLVSSISVDTVGATKRWLFDTTADSPVKSLSILTSVAAPLPPDAFRPSYAGKSSPVFYSRHLRRDLLPRLSPVADTPSLAEYETHFRRPWIDALFFNFDSPIDYMPDYSREIARAVSIAGLLLTLNHSTEAKEPLLVYLTQYGIDLYGLVQKGHPGWPAHGGHGNGRKLPIVLAGTLLEQAGMQRPNAKFGQDIQTMFGTGWTGATALYAGHYGTTGSGQYGPYEHLQPRDWASSLGEDYRRCCTSSAWVGEALMARLVPGVMAAWNHAPFFAYADRWMTEDDSGFRATIVAQGGKNYNGFPQRKAWDRFVTNMWAAYR